MPERTGINAYEVLRLRIDGSITEEKVSVSELTGSGSSIHARDIISLSLCGDRQRISPHLILPRGECIVLALCQIKAIIQKDSLVVFGPHSPPVRRWMEETSNYLSELEGLPEGGFEMLILEEALREVSDTYARRVSLYRPLVDTLLGTSRDDDQVVVESGLHRVSILKDSLNEFELDVKDLATLIQTILSTEEDLFGLVLTKTENKESLDEAAKEVELLLENYHRRLMLSNYDIVAMLRMVQSKQELAAISLDVYRNRMVRMNVHLGIGGVSLGVITAIAGYIGMNVTIPDSITVLGGSPFWCLVGLSTLTAAAVHISCTTYLSGFGLRKRAQERMNEISVLQGILGDMNRLDGVFKFIAGAEELTRDSFRDALVQASPGRRVSDLEVDLLFTSFDRSGDGVLQQDEFHFLRRQTAPRPHRTMHQL